MTHASRNDNWDVHENTRFMHPDCGMGIIYRSPKHFVGDPCNCDRMSSHTYDKLSCGKTNATPEGWAAGCGYVDGQIIEVRIVYTTDTDRKPTASTALQPKEYIPQIYDDYTEVPCPSSEEKHKETDWGSTEALVETERESTADPMETEKGSAEAPVETEQEPAEHPTEIQQESTKIPTETEPMVNTETSDEKEWEPLA